MSLTSCAISARVSWPPSLCETRVLQHQERRESEIADWDPRELGELGGGTSPASIPAGSLQVSRRVGPPPQRFGVSVKDQMVF